MKAKLYKVLFFAIGLLTLGYMTHSLGWGTISSSVKQIGWWFVVIIGSWLLVYICNAIAFNQVIHEPKDPSTKLPFGSILYVTITGYIINYITPFIALGGEPYRIMELKPKLGIEKASSSVLLYSLMHMFSHVVFWLVSIIFLIAIVDLSTYMHIVFVAIFLLGLLLCYWFVLIYRNGFTLQSFKYLKRLPWVGKKLAAFEEEHFETLNNIDEQIRAFYGDRKKQFYASLWWEFFARIVSCAEIYFTANALSADMSILQALLVSSGSSLLANAAFFFPMQLGVREGGLALALKSVGFTSALGLLIGVVVRIRELVWIGIGLLLIALKRRNKDLTYD
ncbi:lysylphosphatidylglycerol synthase domain-containing protein [Olivibacter sitiensis]|uniref:lysylphosphatidylglycerol synthase domain-containing protein n=1 Tax=Olivibacter sitiensis TaxID=376470 RepID=UPI00040A17A2|nr:lysylphosphatidylglycerol synthase domain-containing protein [Olivibacter sitiensis]